MLPTPLTCVAYVTRWQRGKTTARAHHILLTWKIASALRRLTRIERITEHAAAGALYDPHKPPTSLSPRRSKFHL